MLINKDNFEFVGGILVKLDFNFGVVKWVKALILVGFDDMGYDKGLERRESEILLNFLGVFEDLDMLDF